MLPYVLNLTCRALRLQPRAAVCIYGRAPGRLPPGPRDNHPRVQVHLHPGRTASRSKDNPHVTRQHCGLPQGRDARLDGAVFVRRGPDGRYRAGGTVRVGHSARQPMVRIHSALRASELVWVKIHNIYWFAVDAVFSRKLRRPFHNGGVTDAVGSQSKPREHPRAGPGGQ
jgi:hypothetical protein